MKISSVRSFLLSYPFAEPVKLSFHGGERTILKRDALFVRVASDNALVGYAPGPASETAHEAITRTIGPFLEGRTLADPDALRVQFFDGPGRHDAGARKAFCAVEIALYDLLGQALDLPVSELLGGRARDRIRLYSSAGMYQTPAGYAEEAAAMKALGFPAYKMRPGRGPDEDLEAVRLMREATGPEFELMIDAHTWWRMGDHSYSAETVERLADAFDEYHPVWLEEPLAPHDHDAYRALQEKRLVPLAAGEHEPDEAGFLDLIDSHAVDYAQMDVACQGGYAMGRRLLAEVAREGLRFAFHSWGTALELIAAAHLGICSPETVVEWLEYPVYSTESIRSMYPFPLAAEILTEPLDVVRGELTVPTRAGLGVKVDERVVERYPWVPGPWSYFRLDAPPGTWAVTSDHSIQFVKA